MELNFVLTSKNGKQIRSVRVYELSAGVKGAINSSYSKDRLSRWRLAACVFCFVRFLQSVWFYILPEGSNNFCACFFLNWSSQNSLQLRWKLIFFGLVVRMHTNSADDWVGGLGEWFWVLSFYAEAIKLISIWNLGFDPVYTLIVIFISWKLNFDFFEER